MTKKYIHDFKGIHANKRCFILGNGPSLKREHLIKLKDEITFGGKRLYLMSDIHTKYYTIMDINGLEFSKVLDFDCDYKFVHSKYVMFREYADMVPITAYRPYFFGYFPKFSFDCSKLIYGGATITFINLQLAVYMGCNPIYLLGQDWWSEEDMLYGKGYQSHFYKDTGATPPYRRNKDKIKTLRKQNQTMSYGAKILKKHNINVYNITKDTKLKAFEIKEIDIDTINAEKN